MKKTVTLQKEFEELLVELKRLKSINEITTENSNSAKNTIDEINSFANAIDKFIKTINKDYEAKKEDSKNIENSLIRSIEALNRAKNENTELFQKQQKDFANKTNKTVEKFNSSLKNEIERFKYETEIVKKTIKSHINELAETTAENLNNETLKIQEVLRDVSKKQNSDFQKLLRENQDQASALKTGLTETKACFNMEISYMNEQSAKNNASLLEEFKLLNEKTEINKKKVNQLNIAVLAAVAIVIILLCVLLFR